MADWDADDFEPDVPATVTVPKVTDKWEGEDEDDDVKVTPFCLPFSLYLLWPVELHMLLHQEIVKVILAWDFLLEI